MARLMTQHCAAVSAQRPRDAVAQQAVLAALARHTPRVPADLTTALEDTEITAEEVGGALARARSGKAAGPDGLPVELWKHYRQRVGGLLARVFTAAWQQGALPPGFLDGAITIAYKKGDPLEPSNYRPLTMLNTDYRVLARLLSDRLLPALDAVIPLTQTAFLPGRRIGDTILLHQLLPDALRNDRSAAILLSLDIQKAFDTAPRAHHQRPRHPGRAAAVCATDLPTPDRHTRVRLRQRLHLSRWCSSRRACAKAARFRRRCTSWSRRRWKRGCRRRGWVSPGPAAWGRRRRRRTAAAEGTATAAAAAAAGAATAGATASAHSTSPAPTRAGPVAGPDGAGPGGGHAAATAAASGPHQPLLCTSQYADDTNVVLRDWAAVEAFEPAMLTFYGATGQRPNPDKCSLLLIGGDAAVAALRAQAERMQPSAQPTPRRASQRDKLRAGREEQQGQRERRRQRRSPTRAGLARGHAGAAAA